MIPEISLGDYSMMSGDGEAEVVVRLKLHSKYDFLYVDCSNFETEKEEEVAQELQFDDVCYDSIL